MKNIQYINKGINCMELKIPRLVLATPEPSCPLFQRGRNSCSISKNAQVAEAVSSPPLEKGAANICNADIKRGILNPIQFILIGLIAIGLAGCSATSETFDCKEGKGVGCKSISDVNKMVDQGNFGDASSIPNINLPVIAPPSPKIQYVDAPQSDDMTINRVKEEHLRVWIAPFQDEYGNLHEGSVIHTVVKPGYWHIQGAI